MASAGMNASRTEMFIILLMVDVNFNIKCPQFENYIASYLLI